LLPQLVVSVPRAGFTTSKSMLQLALVSGQVTHLPAMHEPVLSDELLKPHAPVFALHLPSPSKHSSHSFEQARLQHTPFTQKREGHWTSIVHPWPSVTNTQSPLMSHVAPTGHDCVPLVKQSEETDGDDAEFAPAKHVPGRTQPM
jgi:hypothetical protein